MYIYSSVCVCLSTGDFNQNRPNTREEAARLQAEEEAAAAASESARLRDANIDVYSYHRYIHRFA